MRLDLAKGKYIAAISGGVDSMTLMYMMTQKSGVEFVVGHFDHGIRPDSPKDAELVAKTARDYGLEFETGKGHLGRGASEEQARKARYKFLGQLKLKYAADYIVTAHHQDDLIETAFINVLRGTGRRGISSIADSPDIKRPLLSASKNDIIEYAKKHNLAWRDDSTNSDDNYLRNYLRNNVLINLSNNKKSEVLEKVTKLGEINKTINVFIASLSQDINKNGRIDRYKFTTQPQEIADELVIYWLKSKNLTYNKKTVDRVSMAIKTAKKGSKIDINSHTKLTINHDWAQIENSIVQAPGIMFLTHG
jgi:tRNA(Ile)-lysidine synthase